MDDKHIYYKITDCYSLCSFIWARWARMDCRSGGSAGTATCRPCAATPASPRSAECARRRACRGGALRSLLGQHAHSTRSLYTLTLHAHSTRSLYTLTQDAHSTRSVIYPGHCSISSLRTLLSQQALWTNHSLPVTFKACNRRTVAYSKYFFRRVVISISIEY